MEHRGARACCPPTGTSSRTAHGAWTSHPWRGGAVFILGHYLHDRTCMKCGASRPPFLRDHRQNTLQGLNLAQHGNSRLLRGLCQGLGRLWCKETQLSRSPLWDRSKG